MDELLLKLENELSEELDKEIEWRVYEIAILKKTPLISTIKQSNKEILYKHSIPAFYALWEGFVSKAFEIYANKLNRLSLTFDNIHPNILTHDLDMKKSLKDGRTGLDKQIELALDLKKYFEQDIVISGNVPTKSNVSFRTINNILIRFNLEKFNKAKFEFRMQKLLKYRNDIAHGENSLNVDSDVIGETSETSLLCMYELRDIIEKGFKEKTYLK